METPIEFREMLVSPVTALAVSIGDSLHDLPEYPFCVLEPYNCSVFSLHSHKL